MSQKKTEGSVFAQAHTAAANFAAEKTTRKRRKPQDHLEYDVMRAEALGYGCHYGKYKAAHPETQAEFERLNGPKQEKVDQQKKMRTCPCCGVKFFVSGTNKNKTYCSDDCRQKTQQARAVGRGPALYCVQCGGEIPRRCHRTKYCSEECAREADKARWRKMKEATEIVSNQ